MSPVLKMGPGQGPAAWLIEEARLEAIKSPCAKSKRGVIVYCSEIVNLYRDTVDADLNDHVRNRIIIGRGFNGQPSGFCDATARCRELCNQRCVHAEMRALRGIRAGGATLLHVKVVDGQVVPGGGPSCWQCSREIVDSNLLGVWLYQDPYVNATTAPAWCYYSAFSFHRETLRHHGFDEPAVSR
jgi:deoxycytidylate deaminase